MHLQDTSTQNNLYTDILKIRKLKTRIFCYINTTQQMLKNIQTRSLHHCARQIIPDFTTMITRLHQCALPWWIRYNLCFLRHTRVHNPNVIGSAIFAQLTAVSLGMSLTLIIAPSHGGYGHHLLHAFLDPPKSITHLGISIGSAIFAQFMSRVSSGMPFPSKLPQPWGSVPPSNTWFLGSTQLSIPNGISIGSAVFAELTVESPVLYNGHPFPPKLPPSHGGRIWTPWVHSSIQPKHHLDWFSRFCTVTADIAILYNGTPLALSKLPLPINGCGPHLIHGSSGPPESSTQMVSRSVEPFLQGSIVWQTDRPRYPVGNNRPHLRTKYCDAA